MTNFKDREKGFGAKFSHDQEINFKVNSRRNKLLGLWAAEQFGLEGSAAEHYARDVIEADFEEPGDADVVRKLLEDFKLKGKTLSEHQLRLEMDRLAGEARLQIEAQDSAKEE
jgi:hypothetical protein